MKAGIIGKILEYFYRSTRYRSELQGAPYLFFGSSSMPNDPNAVALFNEWLLFCFKLSSGRNLLEEYIIEEGKNSDPTDLKIYKNLLDNKYGIFEVREIIKNKGLLLADLQSNIKYNTEEKTATNYLKEGNVFIGRIGRVEDHFELVGSNPIILQGAASEKFRKSIPVRAQFDPSIVWFVLYSQKSR